MGGRCQIHTKHMLCFPWVSAIMGLQFPTTYEKETRKTGEFYLGRSELRVSDQKLTYESPLDSKDIKQVNPKGKQH